MSDFKERLEQERRRFAMGGDSYQDLERRRDRKRRNRRLGSGLVGLAIAAAGIGAGLYAFRPTGQGKPADSPSPIQSSVSSPAPSPSETPSGVPPVEAGAAPAVSGPLQFVDDQHGWMVDPEVGKILVTADRGHSWQVQLSDPPTVKAIDMLDAQTGWALLDDGLLGTTDGGAHWSRVSQVPLSSVQFLSSDLGWGIEQPGSRLLRTENGGATWKPLETPIPADSVCFADDQQGWVVGVADGTTPTFYRTQDGGTTWSSSEMPLPADWGGPNLQAVRCDPSGANAFAVAFGGVAAGSEAYAGIEATAVGGSIEQHVVFVSGLASGTFHPEGAYVVNDPYAGVFAVAHRGIGYFINWCPACEGQTFVTRTHGDPATVTDRIELPKAQGATGPEEPLGVSFIDPDRGWVLLQVPAPKGQEAMTLVLQTTDGGATWSTVCDGSSTHCIGTTSVP
jgi:photosystem II stability/assembly factor-like uncharacterized protein